MTVSIATIQRMVCAEFNVTLIALLSQRRSRAITWVRQAGCYLASELTTQSAASIGRHFNRDHSTVLHARAVVAQRIGVDPSFAARVDAIRQAVIDADGPPAYPAALTATPRRVTFVLWPVTFQQPEESVVSRETVSA